MFPSNFKAAKVSVVATTSFTFSRPSGALPPQSSTPHATTRPSDFKAVKAMDKSVVTMLGGSGVESIDENLLNDVDIISSDVSSAIIEASRLVSSTTLNGNLEDYLSFIGEKVKRTRILKGWNQQKLADESGLDRTYISSVENGKQNLTLGVLLRIGNAFGIDIQTLINRE